MTTINTGIGIGSLDRKDGDYKGLSLEVKTREEDDVPVNSLVLEETTTSDQGKLKRERCYAIRNCFINAFFIITPIVIDALQYLSFKKTAETNYSTRKNELDQEININISYPTFINETNANNSKFDSTISSISFISFFILLGVLINSAALCIKDINAQHLRYQICNAVTAILTISYGIFIATSTPFNWTGGAFAAYSSFVLINAISKNKLVACCSKMNGCLRTLASRVSICCSKFLCKRRTVTI